MSTPRMSRRDVLLHGSMAVAGLALLRAPRLAYAFSAQPREEVLTWLDQPAPNPVPDVVGNQFRWEALDSWITPNDRSFTVAHYDKPVLDAAIWRLPIGGLVQQPLSLTYDDLKARPRQEVTFTLECSGYDGLPFLTGAVGNGTWAGTPPAPVLAEAGLLDHYRVSRSSSSAATNHMTVKDDLHHEVDDLDEAGADELLKYTRLSDEKNERRAEDERARLARDELALTQNRDETLHGASSPGATETRPLQFGSFTTTLLTGELEGRTSLQSAQ